MKEDYLFISYSSRDKVFVDLVIGKLRDRNVNIWIDDELTKHVGEEWFDIVKDRVCSKYCKGVLFFISKTSVSSQQVLKELEYVKSKEVRASHRGKPLRILPIEAEKNISQIDEWLYDLRDAKEDERETNENWREEQNAIDLFREICFPDNNMLRIQLNNDIEAMIHHLFDTIQKEFPSVINDVDANIFSNMTVRETYVYERCGRCHINPFQSVLCHKPVRLELLSQNYGLFPPVIDLYINNGKCVVGRMNLVSADQADYCFDSVLSFISRKHFCIEIDGGEILIADLGSINGTFLNGVQLQPQLRHPISTNDQIMISLENQLTYRVVL